MKKQSRLQFTEEERADPTLEKPIAKSEKAADKMEKAQAKLSKKTIKTKERTFDAETGKTKVRLFFEEVDKPKPPSKLEHSIKKAPQRAVLSSVHKKISEDEQDNVGLEAAQAEGSFGDLKQNMRFRRYLSRGGVNVLAESALLAMAKNLNKLHHKIQKGKTGTHLFALKSA